MTNPIISDANEPAVRPQGRLDGSEADEETGEPVDATDGDDAGPAGDEGQQPERRETREARYRRQLRETEAERDQLRDLVRALREEAVMRAAERYLAQPQDAILWGLADADALDDDGLVDTAKVAEACKALIKSRPGLARGVRGPDFGQGARGGPTPTRPSWSDVLKQRG